MTVLLCLIIPCMSVSAGDLIIDAGNGLHWQSNKNYYLAEGRVRIVYDDMIIWSNSAQAYYMQSPDDIDNIKLDGLVSIKIKNINIQGDNADISLKDRTMRLIGKNLRVDIGDIALSAEDKLYLNLDTQLICAEGKVILLHGAQKISANRLKIDFNVTNTKSITINNVHFIDDVRASDNNTNLSQSIYFEAKLGVYNVQDNLIRLCGNTKILYGSNLLTANCAYYNVASKNFYLSSNNTNSSDLDEFNESIIDQKATDKRTRLIMQINKR